MADHQCDNCVKGILSEGNPVGTDGKIGGVDAYFAKPEGETKSAIIIATDAFGSAFVNTRLVADSLALHTGFLVVVPELFDGEPMDIRVFSEPDQAKRMAMFGPWVAKHGPPESKLPILQRVIQELKEKQGIKSIGAVGYCFGGKLSAVLAAGDETTANIIAHPAPIKPEEIEAIKRPTLWLCAEIDNTFTPENRKQAQEILETKGVKNTFIDYPGTTHGFAIRGDDKDEIVKKAKLAALEATINFFKQELSH